MLVYAAVFSLSFIISVIAERLWARKGEAELPRYISVGALLVAVVLAGVSSLRWRVGTDYWSYERLFYLYAAEVAEGGLTVLGEPGLRVIAWLAMEINGDSATMFAMAAVITIGLSVRTLWKWSPAFAFSIAIYILSGAWHGSFNGIRQFLACAIIFAGHRYIIERSLYKWLAVVFVAVLFHVSAVVAILFYLLPVRRSSFNIQAALLVLGIAGMFGMGYFTDFLEASTGNATRWGGEYTHTTVNPLRVAFACAPLLLFWGLKVRKAIDSSNGWFYINMLVVYAATYLASAGSAMVARFALYPLPFIAIGLVYATAVENRRERALIRGALLLVFAVFMYVEISVTANLRNFQWIFERT